MRRQKQLTPNADEVKMEKVMAAQSELMIRIVQLEIALATEREKTKAIGEKCKATEEELLKLAKVKRQVIAPSTAEAKRVWQRQVQQPQGPAFRK